MIKVAKIKPLGGHRLRATFSDGMAGEYDFSAIVAGRMCLRLPMQINGLL